MNANSSMCTVHQSRALCRAVLTGTETAYKSSISILLGRGKICVGAYKKELRSTIGFGAVYVLLGHTGLFALMLGTSNDTRLFGLPIHYVIAIVLGSLGVFMVSMVWTRYANNLEDEINAENQAAAEQAK